MARSRPLKPAKVHGVAVFPKSGGVRIERQDWPRQIGDQELAAAEAFAEILWLRTGRRLEALRLLDDEGDHDVAGTEDGLRVLLQVTELVTRDYATVLDGGSYSIDKDALNGALERLIRQKVEKRYAREQGAHLILLAYSVDRGASEFIITQVTDDEGTRQVLPEGLRRAQRAAATDSGPFDEIWYVAPLPGTGLLAGVLPAERP